MMDTFTLVTLILLSGSFVFGQEPYFNDWLTVSTSIPFGLFTPSEEIRNTSLLHGSCRQYKYYEDERCKFYGDCCAMAPTRILERLPDNTFSCHNGYYVIDKCPTGSNSAVKKECEMKADGKSSKWGVSH